MTTSRTLRRREVKEQQKLAAERLNEQKRIEALTAFQQKYLQCTDSILAQYGPTSSSNMVSIALFNAAEEITQKLLRDSNAIAKKLDRTNIEPSDVHFASLNLYKAKDNNKKRDTEINKAINEQKFPPISNTAIHYGPIQKILVAPIYVEPAMPKKEEPAMPKKEEPQSIPSSQISMGSSSDTAHLLNNSD